MFHRFMATIALLSLTLGLSQQANASRASISADKDKSCVAQCRADFHQCIREGQSEFFCRLEYALCLADCLIPGAVIESDAKIVGGGEVGFWVIEKDDSGTTFVGLDYYGDVIAVFSSNDKPQIYGSQSESELSASLVSSLRRATR